VKHILFVCTGNTCRSPMAEGIFRKMIRQDGLDAEVRSAGVAAVDHMPISDSASRILRDRGASESTTSNALTEGLVKWADLILTMTMGHKTNVIQRFPQAVDKIYTLKEYVEDNEEVRQNIQERNKLYSEMQLKYALTREIHDHDRNRLAELETKMPDYDISDPFGGTLDQYASCAEEIEACLNKLRKKL
jgi:protein-tyrosine-phosphatase